MRQRATLLLAFLAGMVALAAATSGQQSRLRMQPVKVPADGGGGGTNGAADGAEPRLQMKPIRVPGAGGASNGGADDWPEPFPSPEGAPGRYSGYFKLNRTYDAHM